MQQVFGRASSATTREPGLKLEVAAEEANPQLLSQIRQQIPLAGDAILQLQSAEGYWCGTLTGDSTLLADYILLQLWLHPPVEGSGWQPPNPDRMHQVVRAIWSHQLPDGGWNIFPGGPAEINPTVRAYVSLKLMGADPEAPGMQLARERILALGGLHACNSYTKINLSFFGLFPRVLVPSIPPEILIIPGNFLYEMSSWTRTIIVPLSIVQALGMERPVPKDFTIDELICSNAEIALTRRDITSRVFHHVDKLLKRWERRGMQKIRTKAIAEAERWMLEHMQKTEGLGGIFPGMMYSIMAMDSLEYERDHPDLLNAIQHLEDLLIDTEGRFFFQPCKSPVWDTAIATFSLGEMDYLKEEETSQIADWLLSKEVRRKGDWSAKRPNLRPSGWAFEFANEFYPDIDDTAMVLLALQHVKASDPAKQALAEQRAINWLVGMQSADGGWAAFDADNDWQILNKVPFADHNAMLDPTCADITGRVLEALCRRGFTFEDPTIRRGVNYLLTTQEANGSWYGRWGVNYIYGTFLALRGLNAATRSKSKHATVKAANWLISIQNPDGGWGESCISYEKGEYVGAESTPSQTAWAILGLIAAGRQRSKSARSGVQWLLQRQKAGTWQESLATGTGFPNVYYLNYDLYRYYFPALALASYLGSISQAPVSPRKNALSPS